MQIVGVDDEPAIVRQTVLLLWNWCRSTIGLISLRESSGALSRCTWTTRDIEPN